MPRSEDPEFQARIFPIVILYPGTSTTDMEKLVVEPIEKRINELDEIKQIRSNIYNGHALIRVQFNFEADYDKKKQELITEIDALKKDLPQDIHDIEIRKVAPSDVNVIQLAFLSEDRSFRDLRNYADDLKNELDNIKSLKNVKVWGIPNQIINISLNYKLITQLKLQISQIIQIVQSENINIPAGSVNMGMNQFSVLSSGNLHTMEDIENVIISSSKENFIRLKDVATIKYEDAPAKHICRHNGERSVFLTAGLKANKNIIDVSEEYNDIISNYKQKLPPDIELIQNFDQAQNVSKRLNRLGIDFIFAISLVMITLLPLGFRASFVVMLSIPISLSIGIAFLSFFGYTLNQLSIVGFVMTLGLVVDDNIIVVENIERWLRGGYNKDVAAIKATKQITKAIIGCTAILIVCFVPLTFMPGESGEFIKSLPIAIMSTVFASLLVSLTIVPFLSTLLLKSKDESKSNKLLKLMEKGIHFTYSKILMKSLKHPIRVLLLTGVLFIGSLFLAYKIGFRLFPKSEKPQFSINIKSGSASNINETDQIVRQVENILSSNKEVKYYSTNIGRGNPRIYYNEMQLETAENYSQIFVQLLKDVSTKRKTQIIKQLQKDLDSIPNADITVKDFEQGSVLEAPVAVRIFGDNLDSLKKISMNFEQIIGEVKGTTHVINSINESKTEIQFKVNKEVASLLGISTYDINKTLRLAVSGLTLGTITAEDGYEYKIRLSSIKEKKATYSTLTNIYIGTRYGEFIPLSAICEIELVRSFPVINHLDKNRFTTITAYIHDGFMPNDVNKTIKSSLKKLELPENYHFKMAGEVENTKDSFEGFSSILIICGFIFLGILILEFGDFRSLIIVLSVIPLGIIGAIFLLYIADLPLSFVAVIGFIALIGIEIKNSILLVDFTNQLRSEGHALDKAILLAGEVRFVPILFTAVTAIVGLIPLVIKFSPLYSPLALVIIGGLITSTMFSRIVTPIMYKLFPPNL